MRGEEDRMALYIGTILNPSVSFHYMNAMEPDRQVIERHLRKVPQIGWVTTSNLLIHNESMSWNGTTRDGGIICTQ